MQNKGLIRVFAIIFGLVCLFQLSYTVLTNNVEKKADTFAIAKADGNSELKDEIERKYLDSIGEDPIALGITYNEAKGKELNKGLDLKGGINVILQISVKDILTGLANDSKKPEFIAALAAADERQKDGQNTYFQDFVDAFEDNAGDVKLADPDIFSNSVLDEKVSYDMSNDAVRTVLNKEIDESIQSAFETLRNRIDKFGVTQPNIQRLGESGRILVELPGAKDMERAKKLLSSTAQLEFYQTHNASDAVEYLFAVNDALKAKADQAKAADEQAQDTEVQDCLLYTSPSPRDLSTSRMPSSA